MPYDQGDHSGKPGKHRMSENASQRMHRRPAQKRAQSAANELLREPVQERQGRRSEQNQGRSYCHQQNVLHHMDREQVIIKGLERRTDGDPHRKQSSHKSSKPPRRNCVWKSTPQTKPASRVDERYENESKGNRDWEKPRFVGGIAYRWHRWLRDGGM